MTPLERAARAMCVDRDPDDQSGGPHPGGEWLDKGTAWWTGYVPQVRAVLAAIREPSEGMVAAGLRSAQARALKIGLTDAQAIHSAMIDAALEEE